MSRAFDFTVVGVIWIIAVVIHTISVELFAPGTPLFDLASSGTEIMDGQARAELWHEILAVWMPLLSAAGISAWAFVREYRRQAVTAPRRI